MQVKDQRIRSLRAAVIGAVLLIAVSDSIAAQSKQKPPTKKPTTQTPVVTPTASEGTTAIAARGRPVSTAAGRAVNAALKTALANANVRNAVRAEVLRQLRVRRPLAIVDGYLATGIDLAPVYQLASVRPTLLAALGTSGATLITDATVSPDRLTISFVPAAFGQALIPQFTADITKALGVNALKSHIPDLAPIVMIFVLAGSGLGLTISFAESLAAFLDWLAAEDPPVYPEGPTYDYDGDGLMNMDDPDDDGDGVNDDVDNYDYDPTRSICDCGRPQIANSFVTGAAGDFLPALVSVLNVARPQAARAVSLGTLLQGRPNTLAVVF
jgi:hypothetical protein